MAGRTTTSVGVDLDAIMNLFTPQSNYDQASILQGMKTLASMGYGTRGSDFYRLPKEQQEKMWNAAMTPQYPMLWKMFHPSAKGELLAPIPSTQEKLPQPPFGGPRKSQFGVEMPSRTIKFPEPPPSSQDMMTNEKQAVTDAMAIQDRFGANEVDAYNEALKPIASMYKIPYQRLLQLVSPLASFTPPPRPVSPPPSRGKGTTTGPAVGGMPSLPSLPETPRAQLRKAPSQMEKTIQGQEELDQALKSNRITQDQYNAILGVQDKIQFITEGGKKYPVRVHPDGSFVVEAPIDIEATPVDVNTQVREAEQAIKHNPSMRGSRISTRFSYGADGKKTVQVTIVPPPIIRPERATTFDKQRQMAIQQLQTEKKPTDPGSVAKKMTDMFKQQQQWQPVVPQGYQPWQVNEDTGQYEPVPTQGGQ